MVFSVVITTFCVQMSKYLGTFTEHLMLTYDKLLSIRPLKQVRKDLITNGVIIELIRLRTVHRLPWRAVIDRIIQLFGTNWPANEPSELTMIKTLSSLYKKYRSLVLKKNLGNFQQSPFHVPCPQLDTCEYLRSCSNSEQVVKKRKEAESDCTVDDVDCVLSELLRPDEENDLSVCQLLGMLCKSFSLVSEHMLGDHLQDGIFSEMSPATLDSETVNLPKTNVCSERDFALLDR